MSDFLLESLNNEQKLAVTNTEGYIRVVAGAGSGKTKALAHRFAYLVSEIGVPPKNILSVTFTNKAANEMKRRIRGLIGDKDMGYIATFHGFCLQILKEDIYALNYPKNFIILDEEDVRSILQDIFEKLNINTREITFKNAIEYIRKCKYKSSYIELISNPDTKDLDKKRAESKMPYDQIFFEFLYEQRKNFGLDFDDMILFTLYIFQINKDIKLKWQQRLNYIMVDEFQDIDSHQYMLVSILSEYHKNLFVVGDPDQTIYTWRGARIEYFMDFDKNFTPCSTIVMNKNYRSLSNIIAASNSLIKNNRNRIEKDLVANRLGDCEVLYFHAKTLEEESEWIAKQILLLKERNIKLSDIAILYRAHYISRSIEEGLLKNNIPYTVYSGVGFYQREEIKDILCYLRLIVFGDDISFKRIVNKPKRNFGKKKLEILQEYVNIKKCSLLTGLYELEKEFPNTKISPFIALIKKYTKTYKEHKLSEILIGVLNESGYEEYLRASGEDERLENLAELKQSIFDYEKQAGEKINLEDYLNHISLFTNIDRNEVKDSIKMMTVHSAKGLEFSAVFICALNEGIFPSSKIRNENELEEERRLAYVAFTRAKDFLFLTDSEGLNFYGDFRYPSRFIFNTEKRNLKYLKELSADLVLKSNTFITQHEASMRNRVILHKVGESIRHKILGKGIIKSFDEKSQTYEIIFEKSETPRTLSINIPLERL